METIRVREQRWADAQGDGEPSGLMSLHQRIANRLKRGR